MTPRQSTSIARAFNRIYKKAKARKTLLLVLSCFVVFITTYLLILPAITLEKDEAVKQGGIDLPQQSEQAEDIQAAQEDNPEGTISCAGKGYEISANCSEAGLPEGTKLDAEEIRESDQDYDALYEEALDAVRKDSKDKKCTLAFAKFYDISLTADGSEIEPEAPVDVSISYDKALKAGDADHVRIVHFATAKDGTVKAETLEGDNVGATIKKGRLEETSFVAESFSVYGVVYVVDFEWDVNGKKYDFTLPGGGAVTLGTLMEVADLGGDAARSFVDDVENVEFSDPELVWVGKAEKDTTVGELKEANGLKVKYTAQLTKGQIKEIDKTAVRAGDWALISLKPFNTEETLTVTMKTGDQFVVKVTDDQVTDISNIDEDKGYVLYTRINGTYYVLKTDGGTVTTTNASDLDTMGNDYKWNIKYVYADGSGKPYYIVKPYNDNSSSLNLNWDTTFSWDNPNDRPLVIQENCNVSITPSGNGFKFEGYNNTKLVVDGGWFAGRRGDNYNEIVIYDQEQLNQYGFTVVSDDYAMGKVCGRNKSGTYIEDAEYDAATNNDKYNQYEIKAQPQSARYIFDYWDLNGEQLDLGATIPARTLAIPYQGSRLTAHFKKDPNYVTPDDEKEGRIIDKESFQNWLTELRKRNIPLNQKECTKTAELYDYENRIYRVDLTAKSNLSMFDGDIDLGFIIDVSGSMQFPSKLDPVAGYESIDVLHLNDNWNTQNSIDKSKTYFFVVDRTNTANVIRLKWGHWPSGNPNSSSTQWYDGWGISGYGYASDDVVEASTRYYTNAGHALFGGDDGPFQLYTAGDNGKRRREYLESSIAGTISELNSILGDLAYAQNAGEAADVKIAYNTFANDVDYNHTNHNFVSVTSGLSIGYDYKGGTDTEEALIDADRFFWNDSATKVAVLITDGAPQQEGVDGPTLDARVKAAADTLKDQGIKLITVGLSMGDVKRGSRLLYDIATKDSDGDPYFYKADTGDELQYALYEVIQHVMADAIVVGNVTDTINEAFYPVDKNTGAPLEAGNVIDLAGNKIADRERDLTNEQKTAGYGVIGVDNDGNYNVTWNGQNFTWDGWHGTVYEKAKEDFLGGNAVRTNAPDKPAKIVSEGYKIRPEDPTIAFKPEIKEQGTKTLETPRVNVNELDLTDASTEWTVYRGTEVDPKAQLKAFYDNILVKEVVTAAEDVNRDGFPDKMTGNSLYYPLLESISDGRESSATGEKVTFKLKDLLKKLNNGTDITIDDLIGAGAEGITLPYGLYGQDCPGTINIRLKKTGETAAYGPHGTTVTGDAVETYELLVDFAPDYEHVPIGQGGDGSKPYHTGSYGLAYQGHAAGEDYSTNKHVINVYNVPLDVLKTDESNHPLSGATFKLYKAGGSGSVSGLSGHFTEVASGTSGRDGVAHLTFADGMETGLVPGTTYYLVEDKAPQNYMKDDTVWTVQVQTENGKFTNLDGRTIHAENYPTLDASMYPFNWDQGARIVVDGQPVKVVAKGETEGTSVDVTDGSYVSHKDAISFRHTVENIKSNIDINVNKSWEDNDDPNRPSSVRVKLYRVSEKGHQWGNGTIVPCTCTENGVKEYTCAVCGAKDTHVITASGHKPGAAHRENEQEPTCTEPGGYDTVVRCTVCNAIISSEHTELPSLGHSWENKEVTTSDPDNYCYDTVDVCSVCGEVDEGTRAHHDHDWGEWEIETDAAINKSGLRKRVCNHDPSHIETEVIEPKKATVTIYFRCIGNGNGRIEMPGQVTNITSRTGTGTGDMTIQWNWDQWTTPKPLIVDGLGNSTYSTSSSSNNTGARQTLTISNITENLTIYVTIRNGGWAGTNNSLIGQPTFAGLPAAANTASAPKRSLKSIAKGLLNSLFDGDEKSGQAQLRGSESSMTSEELSEYLSGLKNKAAASCRENEDHLYKEEVDTYTIKADENWTLPINNLPKYNEYGKEYSYYVVEEDSSGAYAITYQGQTGGLHDGDTATINNKQKPGSLKISKNVEVTGGSAANLADGTYTFEIWNADGTSRITKKADGSTDIGTLQITVTDGVADPAELTVDGLTAGTYLVKETASTNTGTMIDTSVSGYNASLGGIVVTVSPGDVEEVQTAAFTNKYETTSVTVKKVWDDNNSSDRPQSLTVTLLADGEPTDKTVTLSEQNHWEDSIDGLPKYKEGVEIDYHWLEGSMPDGYFLTDISKDGAVTTLTNKLLKYDLKTSYTGIKSWTDDNNKYSTRPHELTVTLYADGEALSNEPVWNYDAGTNQWAYTFENLPVFSKDGTLIHYTAQETVPGGYIKTDESQTPTTGQFGTVTYENGRERVTPDNQIVWKLGSLIDLSFVAIKPTANGDVVVWTHRAPVPSEKTAITNAIRDGALPGCQNRNIVFYSGTGDVYTPHGNVHVTYDQEHLSVTLDFGSTDVWSQFIVGQFNKNNSSSYNIGTTAFTNELETTDISGKKTWAIEGEDIPADPILTLTRTVTTDDGEGNTTTSAPETVTVTVNGNPVHLQPAWTGTGKEKTFTYTGLPKKDQNGNKYTYSVAEASFVIGTGEEAVTYTAVKAADGTYTVTADKEGADPFVVTQEGNAIVNGPLGTTIEIIKVEEGHKDSSHTLSGAQFRLTRVNEESNNDYIGSGAYQSEIQTVDSETGRVFFSGLKPGRYRLDEITPPEGYILIETPWFLRVNARGEAALEVEYSLASVNENGENSFYIENTPGPELPSSGGPGTTWIYLIGSLLLLGCGVALVTRRRMKA